MTQVSATKPAFTTYGHLNFEVRSTALGQEAELVQDALARKLADVIALRPVPPPYDVLDDTLGRLVSGRWPEPCEAAFEFILAKSPRGLASLIEGGRLASTDLTFAAEILGRHGDGELVRRILVPLLQHDDAVVREGALYGLASHLDPATRGAILRVTQDDPNTAVREAAAELLDEP